MNMNGEYIAERVLPELVKEACARQGIDFASFSDDWILRLQKGGKTEWVVGYGFGLNNSSSDRLANDKVGQFLAMHEAGIPCFEHYLAKSLAGPKVLYNELQHLNHSKPYVTKPLSSSGGRGVQLHSTLDEALHSIDNGKPEEWSVSPYYDIKSEKRLIVLDDKVLLTYEKQNPTERGGLRMFNLGLGATPKNCEATPEEKSMAINAMKACNLRLSATDIVTLTDGTQMIIELNSGIMMENYARYSDENYAVTRKVYDEIVSTLFLT